jgi:hypothetical protein
MTERDIFLALLDLPDPAARSAFLDSACAGDAALRAQVESLLRYHDDASNFLSRPALPPVPPDGGDTQEAVAQADSDGRAAAGGNDLSFLAAPTRPDALGRLGHYEALEVLGKGGFGIVFRAFDEALQRVVAVKVLAPELATTSPARKRFLREARSAARVRHENVVQVYAVEEEPLPYLVMEFVPGETLQQRLDRTGPLEVPEVVRLGRQIAQGLAAAHATGLIHRDVKPGNILIEAGPNQHVKLTDFGLARAADDASLSQSGLIAGTPLYMAPEQASADALDHRADLFSLGSVLYAMCTGRPPFRAPTTLAVLKRVAEDTPRPIREIIPEVPEWLCDLITRLHAKKPEDRYQSAREAADILSVCDAQLKAGARLKNLSQSPQRKPAARWSGRWKWVVAAALLLPALALALTEIAGVTHWFRNQQPTATVIPTVDPKAPLATARFALMFDGQKSMVRIPSLIINDDHALTVEAWTVLEADQPHSCDLLGNARREGFTLYAPLPVHGGDGMKLAFTIRLKNPDKYVLAFEKQPVPRHQLIHVAGVYDGQAEIRFYVNGQLQSRTPAQSVKPSPLPVTLGNNYLGGAGFLGRMNEVRISKVARYDTDFTPAKRFEPDGDTIALYHFDEGEGAVLKDTSGNGHHGEIVGAKWVKADGSPNGTAARSSPGEPRP